MSYYAIPDVHGNLNGLIEATESVLKVIDLEKDTIVFLGDYIDRGENSLGVLEYLYELQKKYGENTIVCLLGNHDDMFLKFLNNSREINFLLNDYKLKTLKSFIGDYFALSDFILSYNYEIVDMITQEDYTFKIIGYIKNKYSKLLDWYSKLPLYLDKISEDNVLFIHAGIEEKVLGVDWKEYTTEEQMIWNYPPNYGYNPYGFSIVCGHVMTDEFWKFSEEPCYDIYVSGNHYYTDGASPFNKKLNILKIENGVYTDFITGKILT